MGHEATFYDNQIQIASFNGFAGGALYLAFDAQHCNAGSSGSGESVIKTVNEIYESIEILKTILGLRITPHDISLTQLIKKLDGWLKNSDDECKIEIAFT